MGSAYVLLLLPFAAAACGGTQAALPSSDAGEDASAVMALPMSEMAACAASQNYVYEQLAGFESTDTPQIIGRNLGNQLAGTFTTFISYDQTGKLFDDSNGLVTPAGCTTGWQPHLGSDLGAKPPAARCGGTDLQALHVHATAFDDGPEGLTNWGLNVGIDLRQNCNCDSTNPSNPPPCRQLTQPELGCTNYCTPTGTHCFFDARGWTGISFWALLGPSSTGTTALLTIPDSNTAGQAGGNDPTHQDLAYPFNQLRCGNPPCVMGPDGGTVDAGMDCTSTSTPACLCDPYGKAVALVNHWEFYAIPFSELRQKGYGRPETALDLAHILGFKLGLGKGVWDVWLDDIAFYKAKSP